MPLAKNSQALSIYIDKAKRDEVKEIASEESRSISKQAEYFLLIGLEAYKAKMLKESM